MKPQNIREIVNQIIYRTGMTQGDIAKKLGYERPYFNTVINNPEKNSDILEQKLRVHFPEYFDMYTNTSTSVKVKSANDDIKKRVDELEKRLQDIEAQLKLIVSLLKK